MSGSLRSKFLPIKIPLGCLLACITVLTWFYWPFLVGQSSFFYTDSTSWLEPISRFNADSLRAGHFPLWNPYCYCGMPEIGVTFPNLFYPIDYLFVCLPYSSAVAGSMILHQTLAASGLYLLLRNWKCSLVGAIAGGAAYSFSGYMFAFPSNHSLVAGAAWLPICLWILQQLRASSVERRFLWCMLSASSISMLILSGRPEVMVPSILLLTAYVVYSWCMDKNHLHHSQAAVWHIRALFLGVTFALPSILPTAEWLSLSRRANGLVDSEVFMYSANWYDMISIVLGNSLGDLREHGAQFRQLISSASLPSFISCAYIGPIALSLAICGVFCCPKKLRYWLLTLLVITVFASLGDSTFVMPFLVKAIPALSVVRFPVKLLFLPMFCLSIFTGFGLDRLTSQSKWLSLPACLSLVLAVLSAGVTAAAHHSVQCINFPVPNGNIALALAAQERLGWSGLQASLAGAIFSVIWLSAHRWSQIYRLVSRGALVILIGSLFLYACANEHQGAPPDYYTQKSAAAEAVRALSSNGKAGRILYLCLERKTIPTTLFSKNEHDNTVEQYEYDHQILEANTNIDFSIPSSFGFEGTMKGDYYYTLIHAYLQSSQTMRPEVAPVSDQSLSRFCQISATSFVITQIFRDRGQHGQHLFFEVPKLDTRFFRLAAQNDSLNFRIYEALQKHPRCFVTSSWNWINSHNKVFDAILGEKSQADFVNAPLLEASGKDPMPMPAPNAKPNLLEPVVIDHDPESIETEVSTDEPTMLILADQKYAGWQADIDSKQVPMYLANGFMRAVYVPAGRHHIQFHYEPGSLKLGWLLFLLGALLATYIGVRSRRDAKSC